MVERAPFLQFFTHALLLACLALLGLPVYVAFVAATQSSAAVNAVPMSLLPGRELLANLAAAWEKADLGRQLLNSMVMASGIALGKVAISILSAFAIVFFRFPFRMVAFWLVFASLMLPVEIRIVPTYQVAANVFEPILWFLDATGLRTALSTLFGIRLQVKWSLLNSYEGLILPLIASATATFLFRQFFMTVPAELIEAAKIDGATPMRFLRSILLPLSKTNIAALLVILFVFGWNQYLWPLLVTTKPEMNTLVMGLTKLMPSMDSRPEWNLVMAASVMALLPPVAVVLILQRWFVKGLVETDK